MQSVWTLVCFESSLLESLRRVPIEGFFFKKNLFHCEKKLWLFGLFSGDKGDNIDMWMIKITIKANQIDMLFCLL